MHGDHHIGFMDFLQMRRKFVPSNRTPFLLMAPKLYFEELLDFYNKNFDDIHSEYTIFDNEDLVGAQKFPSKL